MLFTSLMGSSNGYHREARERRGDPCVKSRHLTDQNKTARDCSRAVSFKLGPEGLRATRRRAAGVALQAGAVAH